MRSDYQFPQSLSNFSKTNVCLFTLIVGFTLLASDFEKLNPLHFVPVLVDGSLVVADSYAILLVLNESSEHHAEAWLRLKKWYQDALPKYTTKLLFSVDVTTNVSR
ncbi:hypothetical protein QQ045_019594 [Rhodiola kirilowii]